LTRGGTVDPFLSGNVAILPSGSWEIPSALNGAKFKWDVVAVPRATASGTSVAVGSVQPVCLAKSGQQVDLAWQFVRFLLGREAQARLATGKVRLPALKEVAADASTGYAVAPPSHVAAAVTAMETARSLDFTVGWQDFRAAVVSALDRAFDGRVALEDGIAAAVTNGNAALAKVASPQ
jgi:multiple sugar transport system substrate-binding protein